MMKQEYDDKEDVEEEVEYDDEDEDDGDDEYYEDDEDDDEITSKRRTSKELGLSCMLNTEVGSVLAVIRKRPDVTPQFCYQEDALDSTILPSLKSLRKLIFDPRKSWKSIDPSIYLAPFLDVISSADVPAGATAVALLSILKIVRLDMFDKKTPGAREAMSNVVMAVTGCRLEKTHPVTEAAVKMRILLILASVMRHPASVLLNDHAVCTIVNTCFQVVQQSPNQGDLLQRTARHTMHELIQIIFSRFPDIEVGDWENSDSDTEDDSEETGYGIRCAVDIFHFLCSLLNVVGMVETDGSPTLTSDEDVQVFALVLINSALELSGDSIRKHYKLLRMVKDDLFHHLIHYGTSSSALVLSMICSTVLNVYYFHRDSIRLQLEAFFSFVLFKTLNQGYLVQLQDLALEGIINFCRQPTFLVEVYINYDCDPLLSNVFEEIGKNLCKHAFLSGSNPAASLQLQAFDGLMVLIHNIADNVDKQNDVSPTGPYPVEISKYKPFWEEIPIPTLKTHSEFETWIDSIRARKAQKRKMMIAGSHFNRDDKKGMDYLKISYLISDPPDPKGLAMFLRYTPGLDKTKIGDFLGDPSEFNLKVLKEFTDTFEFTGLVLDSALRTYLETFRLPGESQKIQRVLEAFSERFYEQQSSEIFETKDAVFILCYSVIMLNTDQHNPQVKKKMTEDEFIRNNRAVNNGKDLPREILSELFSSIASKAITIFGQPGSVIEMNPSRWMQLMNRSELVQPYITCDFDRRIGRDMFAAIAGPTVSTISAVFEHTEDEEVINECIEGLFAVARICQYGLQDSLDELLSSFCKFTTLLNPYASAEETLFSFGHDLKPRMATLAVFTVANNFKDSIRGGWRSIIDCLLKLKRLKLLPQSIVDVGGSSKKHKRTESESVNDQTGRINTSNLMAVISHCLSMENLEESLNLGISEFEQNLKVIQQCKIGSIFSKSSTLPLEPLLYLGRSLIFAAAGKGQKFNTPTEEEETVQFCWDLIQAMASCNVHRLASFWPTYHEYLISAIKNQLVSPSPFAEKAIVALIRICLKLLASKSNEKFAEEVLFKSINVMWQCDGKILDICNEFILKSVTKILNKHSANLLSQLGWKTVLHLLSNMGPHTETYERRVEALINLLEQGTGILVTNYTYCIDCAFRFVALRNSPVDKNMKIMDLMADSVKLIVEWLKIGYSDPGSNTCLNSTATSTLDDVGPTMISMNLFVKLGEVLRKTSLARREEVRNYAVKSLHKTFINAEELYFTPTNIINCINLVIFAMVDDLHEKMLEYSTRENAERETRSMEGTLMLSMEFLVDVYLQFLKLIIESVGFKTFWLGILRRMDTCMKADLGVYGESKMKELVPRLLTKMITTMQEKELLVPQEGNDLWEITYVQIQWIAPSLKDQLFPDAAG